MPIYFKFLFTKQLLSKICRGSSNHAETRCKMRNPAFQSLLIGQPRIKNPITASPKSLLEEMRDIHKDSENPPENVPTNLAKESNGKIDFCKEVFICK